MNRTRNSPGAPQPLPAVVITGASEGIGKAFATMLACKGYTLLLIARHGQALENVAREAGSRVHTLALDLADPHAADRVFEFLEAHALYADILINNAGMGSGGRFDAQTADDVDQLLTVNIAALVRLTHRLLPGMRERRRGGILNIASVAGFMPGPWQALYFASKAFVLSFSQAIAEECEDDGVHVMVAAPGPVETRIHAAMKTGWSFYRRLFPSYEPEHIARLVWNGFERGDRLLVPGLINNLSALAATFMPNDVLVPLVGILVRPRFKSGRTAS